MSNILNPNYKPHLELVADDAAGDALKLIITDHLDANAGASTLDLDTIRALDSQFADDRIWAQLLSDFGLTEIAHQ